jgi:hypothetical protein
MRPRTIAILTACLLSIGFGSFLTTNPASAQAGGDQFCYAGSYCLNAWNGGPEINVYTPGVNNDSFTTIQNSAGYWNFQFTNIEGSSYGDCIGDYGNSSTDARAGLDSDCANGDIPWGANFTAVTQNCPGGEEAYHNVHWGGWLAPSTTGLEDGDPFYLNNADEFCYSETFFVGQ